MDEVTPTLIVPPGIDVEGRKRALCERFKNPALKHRTWQIAMDGSQKLPQRLLAPIRDLLKRGAPIDHVTLGVAAWMRYVTGIDEKGAPIDVRDPLAAKLRAIADKAGPVAERLAPALISVEEVFGSDLPRDPRFVRGGDGGAATALCGGGEEGGRGGCCGRVTLVSISKRLTRPLDLLCRLLQALHFLSELETQLIGFLVRQPLGHVREIPSATSGHPAPTMASSRPTALFQAAISGGRRTSPDRALCAGPAACNRSSPRPKRLSCAGPTPEKVSAICH